MGNSAFDSAAGHPHREREKSFDVHDLDPHPLWPVDIGVPTEFAHPNDQRLIQHSTLPVQIVINAQVRTAGFKTAADIPLVLLLNHRDGPSHGE